MLRGIDSCSTLSLSTSILCWWPENTGLLNSKCHLARMCCAPKHRIAGSQNRHSPEWLLPSQEKYTTSLGPLHGPQKKMHRRRKQFNISGGEVRRSGLFKAAEPSFLRGRISAKPNRLSAAHPGKAEQSRHQILAFAHFRPVGMLPQKG